MEAEELTVGRVHHGHNIRRFRIEKNMNQEVLSQLVHLSQSAVSKYEQMRVIDDRRRKANCFWASEPRPYELNDSIIHVLTQLHKKLICY